jgi:hypothetical protein
VYGKPDLAIVKHKLSIFIDSDLWDGNEHRLRWLDCIEAFFPINTPSFSEYLPANMGRDSLVNDRLNSKKQPSRTGQQEAT